MSMPTASIHNADLFYKEKGVGLPILLIHANGANADLWGSTFERLATRNRIIAYDRRGFSRSRQSPVSNLHQHAEDAATLLQQLRATPATIVGADTGAIIALDLALHHPELVASLVLCEATFHLRKQKAVTAFLDNVRLRYLQKTKGLRAAAEAYYHDLLEEKSGESGFTHLSPEWREVLLTNAEAALQENAAGTGEYIHTHELTQIKQPVTCLVSTRSQPFFREAAQKLASALPQTRNRIITAAGHYMHLDQPNQFLHEITEALPDKLTLTPVGKSNERARQNHKASHNSTVSRQP
ncbi:alpha/beta hydrolase fold protein [Ktedonobacter racemifer DSM 44963]|uniref:Alpha/beta hydrolase fold protein n=2 Tax=Ktedonobacter racemifer TaxID=363277 RepID=D6TFU3_KTERA|nr:alpha/beta hydrolase fold protein [Ktedonobacter racemifer DSM 44963]